MSARYSASPDVRLTLGRSKIRSVLYGALCLFCVLALAALQTRGYTLLAVSLIPVVTGLLWHLRTDQAAGGEICWRQGIWTLGLAEATRVIVPTTRSTSLAWGILLVFDDAFGSPGGRLWIFADSASSEQLRRLRVRLTLLR